MFSLVFGLLEEDDFLRITLGRSSVSAKSTPTLVAVGSVEHFHGALRFHFLTYTRGEAGETNMVYDTFFAQFCVPKLAPTHLLSTCFFPVFEQRFTPHGCDKTGFVRNNNNVKARIPIIGVRSITYDFMSNPSHGALCGAT